MSTISELMQKAKVGERQWTNSVGVQMGLIHALYEDARERKAPESKAALHRSYLEALRLCSSSMEQLADGIDNKRDESLTESLRLMSQCGDILQGLPEVSDLIYPREGGTAEPPRVVVERNMDVREGPGTAYPIIGGAKAGEEYGVVGRTVTGDWWKIEYQGRRGWVYGQLVRPLNAEQVAVATHTAPPLPTATQIPPTTTPRPATATPVPAIVQPTSTSVPAPAQPAEKVYDKSKPCYELKEMGVVPEGGWPRSSPNYTKKRDGDEDGYACE